ncbi:MAG: c-type cytochrome [Bacteroidia bacterium]
MKYLLFILAAEFLLALSSCGQSPKPEISSTATADAPADGEKIYTAKCTVCHGSDGKAGIGGASDLSVSLLDKAGSVQIITNGRKAMRAFSTELTPAEIEAVAGYIQTLKK